jgi:hypothetical protein
MERENEIILINEALREIKTRLAIVGSRQPEESNLLRQQIRLEDRLRALKEEKAHD